MKVDVLELWNLEGFCWIVRVRFLRCLLRLLL